jgi:RimJ/RimL family protein N-acetyltransferase
MFGGRMAPALQQYIQDSHMPANAARQILTTSEPDIRLRPVSLPEDVPVAVTWYRDPEVLYLSQGGDVTPFDAGMVEKMFSMMSTRCEVYIIDVRDRDTWQPVGDASLCREAGTPIVIGDSRYRSRGIGRIVLARLIERARELGWSDMVVSGIYTDNLRARRLYEGAGFTVTGEIDAGNGRRQWKMSLALKVRAQSCSRDTRRARS